MDKKKPDFNSMNLDHVYSLIVRRYFVEMKTKVEIAKELGISRFKVARLIDEAIEKEYIKFIFPKQKNFDNKISKSLCEKYHLQEAIILPSSEYWSTQEELNTKLGEIAANYLSAILKEGMILGIAWGKVLSSTANQLTYLPHIDVVQLSGVHPGIEFTQGPIDIIHKIAAISHGEAHPMYVPMWVNNESLAAKLSEDLSVQNTKKYYANLDVVITGIGDWKSGSSGLSNIFPKPWVDDLMRRDIAADICTTLIDSMGNILKSPIEKLEFGISDEQIKQSKKIIGVAGGEMKFQGIKASVKSGLIDVLITDFDTSLKLLN